MDVKGQGALEYLLLIGGAVLVAAIVIALITGIPTGTIPPEVTTFCANRMSFTECGEIACGLGAFTSADGSTWACQPRTVTGEVAVGAPGFVRCGTAAVAC